MKSQERIMMTAGLALLGAAALGQTAARKIAGFGEWYAHAVYPWIVAAYGRICGLLPFSVVELGLYLLIAGSLYFLVRYWRQWKKTASAAVLVLGTAAALYTFNCGINYYRNPFSSYLDLEIRKSSVEELKSLCTYLTEKVNETVNEEAYSRQWAAEGRKAMENLGERYPELSGYYPNPKPVMISWILSVQQLCGVYSPFTVEANYNRQMTVYNIPHTICHELSHLRGFMREDEANFIGYLACIGSDSQAFRYSGYLTGWVYATNELAKQDMESFVELYGRLSPQAVEALRDNNEFWDKYEGKVAEVSTQVNDTYLKINDQEEGVKTYGRMVDLMLAYYRDGEK